MRALGSMFGRLPSCSISISKFLLAALAHGVREIPIEREDRVAHQRIDPVVEALGGLVARRHVAEHPVELRQVLEVDGQMELGQVLIVDLVDRSGRQEAPFLALLGQRRSTRSTTRNSARSSIRSIVSSRSGPSGPEVRLGKQPSASDR